MEGNGRLSHYNKQSSNALVVSLQQLERFNQKAPIMEGFTWDVETRRNVPVIKEKTISSASSFIGTTGMEVKERSTQHDSRSWHGNFLDLHIAV